MHLVMLIINSICVIMNIANPVSDSNAKPEHIEVHAVQINWPLILSNELFSVNMSYSLMDYTGHRTTIFSDEIITDNLADCSEK